MKRCSEIDKANRIFLEKFGKEVNFERAIFLGWYCATRDCAFCYMSTQNAKTNAIRTKESIIAEAILCKKLGWKIGFLSGGNKAYKKIDFMELLENLNKVYGKIWLNIGILKKPEMEKFCEYSSGIIGAVETMNEKLRRKFCPSKPIRKIESMFKVARELGLKRGITIILGLGESIEDFEKVRDFIKRNEIEKINYYSLNPQKGTIFENAPPIEKEYHALWVAKTRLEFNNINIHAGIWKNKTDNVAILLKAGANGITKFPAIKYFGTNEAKSIENGVKISGRKLIGTFTKLPKVNWEKIVYSLKIDDKIKKKVYTKLKNYLKLMNKHKKINKN